jgi:fluoroacetyl-CoA thioesterase
MRDTMVVGLAHEASYAVTPDMSAPHLPAPVLSTPSMIGLIEGTCFQAMSPHLDSGETSVGAHVCVSHEASVPAGGEITIAVRLSEITKRRLTFETTVTASDDGRVVSRGTHQRAVIDPSRFRGGAGAGA